MMHMSKTTFRILISIFFCLFLSLTGSVARAQDSTASPTPTPPSEEVLRLRLEKEKEELLRDIELAKKARRDAEPQAAATPTPTPPAPPPAPLATPLAGDATLENVRLESEIVSYKALSEAAARLSGEIKGKAIRNHMVKVGDNMESKSEMAKNIAIYDAQVVRDWRFIAPSGPPSTGRF
jgi:hypothetical protein